MMVQFSTLSLSLPPIPNFFQATSPISQGSAIQVYLVLDYHPHPPPPPPDSSRESMIRCSLMQLLLGKRLNKAGVGHTGGAKVQVTGHRLQATGHRSGYRPQVTGLRLQATGHRSGHRSHKKNNTTLDKTVLD